MTAQAMQALARANEVYRGRAKLLREIRAGEKTVRAGMNAGCCASMGLGRLLECQRGWGPARTDRFLRPLQLSPYRQLCELTDRQRGLVADGLAGREHG